MSGKRIEWIDNAKGVAIVLVVLGHIISTNSLLSRFIDSFHMPLFFMLSGLFVLKKTNDSFRSHLNNRFRRLMIPYFILGICVLIPFNWLYFHFIIPSAQISFLQRCLAHFTGLHSDWGEEWRCCLWFLPCLFVADIVIWSIWKYLYKWRYVVLLLLISIGIFYYITINRSLPFRIHTASIAVLFLFIGSILTENIEKISVWLIGLFCICYTFLWISNDFSSIVMADNNYGLIHLSIPASIFASIAIIYLVRHIRHNHILSLIGEQSLAIYILHQLFVPFIRAISLKLSVLGGGITEAIIMTIIAFLVTLICMKMGQLLHEKCLWIFGERRNKVYLLS